MDQGCEEGDGNASAVRVSLRYHVYFSPSVLQCRADVVAGGGIPYPGGKLCISGERAWVHDEFVAINVAIYPAADLTVFLISRLSRHIIAR